jgi:hypothetical protein
VTPDLWSDSEYLKSRLQLYCIKRWWHFTTKYRADEEDVAFKVVWSKLKSRNAFWVESVKSWQQSQLIPPALQRTLTQIDFYRELRTWTGLHLRLDRLARRAEAATLEHLMQLAETPLHNKAIMDCLGSELAAIFARVYHSVEEALDATDEILYINFAAVSRRIAEEDLRLANDRSVEPAEEEVEMADAPVVDPAVENAVEPVEPEVPATVSCVVDELAAPRVTRSTSKRQKTGGD